MDEGELITLIQESATETRRHFDVVTEEMRKDARVVAEETRGHFDLVAEEMRKDARVVAEETRRHFNLVAEETQREVQLVAEGFAQLEGRLKREIIDLREETKRGFARDAGDDQVLVCGARPASHVARNELRAHGAAGSQSSRARVPPVSGTSIGSTTTAAPPSRP